MKSGITPLDKTHLPDEKSGKVKSEKPQKPVYYNWDEVILSIGGVAIIGISKIHYHKN